MGKNNSSSQNRDSQDKDSQQKAFKKDLPLKTKIIVGLFCLLCIYYVYLRFQEAGEGAGQSIAPQNVLSAVETNEPTEEAVVLQTQSPQISQQSSQSPEETSIPYILNGDSGKKQYDSNGNLIDTSNYLKSIKKASDVLPKGFSLDDIPYYYGEGVLEINDNVPSFTDAEIELAKQGAFEYYGPLDNLGRCTVAFDCLGKETMPNGEKRGNISSIHPSGWQQARYDCVDSETVMTRAHLAGYMMSSENANEQNLISGTRYMNSDTMLPYEEAAANWLDRNNGKHLLYRVTPWYDGNNLMADGILMEALSVEDGGKEICFCVYVYNVQPGLKFNYATGRSQYSGIFFDTNAESVITDGIRLGTYGLDLSSDTIHTTKCNVFSALSEEDKVQFSGDRDMQSDWESMGYHLCSSCLK